MMRERGLSGIHKIIDSVTTAFAAVAIVSHRGPFVVSVNPQLPVKSLPELIAYARAHPGRLTYGSGGIGSSSSLGAEMLKSMSEVDIVHVASHNQFHQAQTVECLEHGVAVVVEKTLAINEAGTEDILTYIQRNGHEGRVAPHVHYLEKALALELRHKLWPWALQRSGKLVRASGTFIEDVSEDDLRRQWLFKPENGGIFMDWIHPSAMLANICGAHFASCEEAVGYVVNPAYDPANPTGIEARFRLTGPNLAPNATATIRVGKGFPPLKLMTYSVSPEPRMSLGANRPETNDPFTVAPAVVYLPTVPPLVLVTNRFEPEIAR